MASGLAMSGKSLNRKWNQTMGGATGISRTPQAVLGPAFLGQRHYAENISLE